MRLREQALLLQHLEERRLLTQQLLRATRHAKGLPFICSSCSGTSRHAEATAATEAFLPAVAAALRLTDESNGLVTCVQPSSSTSSRNPSSSSSTSSTSI